jgi:hypothetical protein
MDKSGRVTLALVALTTLMAFAACGEPPSPNQLEETQDVLFFQSADGLAVMEEGSKEPSFQSISAVQSSDWSTVVRSSFVRKTTRITALDPTTGAERWERELDGRFDVKIVSDQGDLVALGPVRENPYIYGRTKTTMVIAGSGMVEPRTIVIDGNYEPEAFSTDGESLFVIKYLPDWKPKQYQVRRLVIGTGEVKDVYTPHDELQTPMGGTARIQAASPDGRRLYTLYTVGGGRSGPRYAFIHVLALDELWAHCIALPVEFASGAESATAITVSPNGERVYVGNAKEDRLVEIDTDKLEVVRASTIDFGSTGAARAAHDSGSTLYLASGTTMTAVDVSNLTSRGTWEMTEKVKGIQVTRDRKTVYVAQKDLVAVVDHATGRTIETFDPPGVDRIDQLGPVMQALDDGIVKCAC